jgi:hypothetical protein
MNLVASFVSVLSIHVMHVLWFTNHRWTIIKGTRVLVLEGQSMNE